VGDRYVDQYMSMYMHTLISENKCYIIGRVESDEWFPSAQ
jgi:hypothetical protein